MKTLHCTAQTERINQPDKPFAGNPSSATSSIIRSDYVLTKGCEGVEWSSTNESEECPYVLQFVLNRRTSQTPTRLRGQIVTGFKEGGGLPPNSMGLCEPGKYLANLKDSSETIPSSSTTLYHSISCRMLGLLLYSVAKVSEAPFSANSRGCAAEKVSGLWQPLLSFS